MTRRTKHVFLLVALPVALLVAAVAVAFWSAQRTLTRSAATARTQHQVGFTLRQLDPAATQAEGPGFEPVLAPAAYQTAATLDSQLYLAGPGGLGIYSADGALERTLRTGFELPIAPIVALTSGRLRGAANTQLLLATSGAGLLLLDPNTHGAPSIHQLLPESAEGRDLTALLPLASGDLLLGTRHAGVLLYNGTTLTPYAGPAKEITALAAGDSASVLIGTRDAGLFYVHAGTVARAEGLPDSQIESLVVGNGKAFAGTPLGVAEFDLAQPDAATFRPTRILAAGLFSHALALAPGELLVGTLDQGVRAIPLGTRGRIRTVSLDLRGDDNTGIRVDSFVQGSTDALADGNLRRRGANGWRPELPASASTLADRNISALAFAPDGSLYVGFFDHGLDILNPSQSSIRHLEDDHLFCVNRLALDPERQTIAAATANGLVLFDRQGTPRQVLTRRDGLISDHVTDVAFTRTGMTLATPAGLTFLAPSGAESLYAFQGLVNNHVYALSSSNDRLLAGTLGGLSVLEGGAVKRNLTAANSGLKHNWITAIAASPQGGWLIGTYGAGIQTLSADGSRFSPVELPAGAPRDLVINPNALLVTRSHVYAGTLGHGMLVFDTAAARWSVVTQGLPSLNITAFAERDGELYIGTENGLVRIAEARLP